MHSPGDEEKPHDLKSISGTMVRGTAWMVSMRWLLRLIGLVNTVIVARLLTPDDFGVIAMAMIIVELLTEISETNVAIALIRNKDATRDHYNSAWTIKILMGTALTVILFALSPLAATYYGDPRVEPVIQIIAFRSMIFGFENIGVVDFRKNLDFAKDFRYATFRRMTQLGISLTLVYILRDYNALAISMLVAASTAVIYSFIMSSFRPRFSLKEARTLWSVSQWLMVDHGFRFIGRRIDWFVLGPIAGSTVVGYYTVADDVSSMPTLEVINPAGRALLPTYARLAHDEAESRRAFLRVIGFIAIYSLPAGVGISVIAEDLVPILLGSQWTPAIVFFQWLGIYASFEGFMWGIRHYFLARGNERTYALANVCYALVMVPAIFAAGHLSGVMAIVMTRTFVMIVMVGVMLCLIARLRYASLEEMAALLWRPLIASGVMWSVLHAFPDLTGGSHVLALLRDVSLGAAVYAGTVVILWFVSGRREGPEEIVLRIVYRRTQRLLG